VPGGASLRISRCICGWEKGGVEHRTGRYLKSGRNGQV
jgi:hypothetical protein